MDAAQESEWVFFKVGFNLCTLVKTQKKQHYCSHSETAFCFYLVS